MLHVDSFFSLQVVPPTVGLQSCMAVYLPRAVSSRTCTFRSVEANPCCSGRPAPGSSKQHICVGAGFLPARPSQWPYPYLFVNLSPRETVFVSQVVILRITSCWTCVRNCLSIWHILLQFKFVFPCPNNILFFGKKETSLLPFSR